KALHALIATGKGVLICRAGIKMRCISIKENYSGSSHKIYLAIMVCQIKPKALIRSFCVLKNI
ncbi:MAG: hypothetical protein NC489_46465, partial [Ruminococcus flavefaciens]|nr:hypothetical protein [Ruminococcus flavefaciens]